MPDSGYVLLTGFEPFGGDLLNPSALLAERLHGSEIKGVRIASARLPVDLARLPVEIERLLDGPSPRAIVNLGLAAGRTAVAVERVAVNALDFNIPDNAGQQIRDRPILPDGPAAYLSRLPLRQSVERLRARGIPAYISDTAGLYLCNACMYLVLHTLAQRGWDIPAGFIHVPFILEQTAQQEAPRASLPLDMLTLATGILVETALAETQTQPLRQVLSSTE